MRAKSRRNRTRFPIVIVGVALCVWGVWTSTLEGLAHRNAGRALFNDSTDDANRAVAFGSTVPEAHYARAIVLERAGSAGALQEFDQAVALRPNDYALWLELGRARDGAGDTPGAIAAFSESVRLAPFYARPRWQLGNALFRSGRMAEAFKELRLAVESNPKLTLQALALIWTALNGNVAEVELVLAPLSPAIETALARFLIKQGKFADAMRHFRAAGGISIDEQRAMASDLIAARNFDAAYEVWATGREKAAASGLIDNGGFEEPIALDQTGFGWQLAQNQQGIQVALDPSERRSGSYSLRVDWSGNADSLLAIASQLVLVEPGSRYQLKFSARGADLVMLGLPSVSVIDPNDASAAGDYRQAAIARSTALPKGTGDWQNYQVDFATPASTRAVIVRIHRESCTIQPCPAFGHTWFDEFSLSKIPQ